MSRGSLALGSALLFGALFGCRGCNKSERTTAAPLVAAADAQAISEGHALVEKFECNRCHDGIVNVVPAPVNKHCTHCHADILSGKMKTSAEDFSRWSKVVLGLEEAPSLTSSDQRLRREWIAGYLLRPTHLRPREAPYMPRLSMTEDEARKIASALAPSAVVDDGEHAIRDADVVRGKALFEKNGCGTCHAFSGSNLTQVAIALPVKMSPDELARGMKLAPDLRAARDRWYAPRLVEWLLAPKKVKPDTMMPDYGLAATDARDLAAFILHAPLSPAPKRPFAKLPLLDRRVTFAEVDSRVLHRTCWHCHSDPDLAIGDGGPGNSGGFGFPGRGLDLGSYAGVRTGILGKVADERTSILKKDASTLVASLLARHAEEDGAPTGPVRGMPLGYAPLSAEDIQLVETWVAQGAPR